MAQKIIGYREMTWTCPNCGAVNQGTEKVCKNCGATMDEETKFEQAANAQVIRDEKVIERAKKGPDVYCAFCGTRNPAGSAKCSQCGADLSEGHERQHGQQYQVRQPNPEQTKPVTCPACGAENPAGTTVCRACGSQLESSKVETVERNPVTPAASNTQSKGGKGCSRGCLIPIIIIVLIVILGMVFSSFRSTGSGGSIFGGGESGFSGGSVFSGGNTVSSSFVNAVVTSTSWETSVEVIGDVSVSKSAWKDQLPRTAYDVSCSSKLYETYDDEVEGTVEKCGEVYSVDLGNGYEALAQDCVYELYKDYCTYFVSSQGVIETKRNSGTNSGPSFAYVDTSKYSLGEKSVNMEITVRDEDGKTYSFAPASVEEFMGVHQGDTYQLEIRNGRVVSKEKK